MARRVSSHLNQVPRYVAMKWYTGAEDAPPPTTLNCACLVVTLMGRLAFSHLSHSSPTALSW